jgi:hypothetical protein
MPPKWLTVTVLVWLVLGRAQTFLIRVTMH